jgi:hypothetical protein
MNLQSFNFVLALFLFALLVLCFVIEVKRRRVYDGFRNSCGQNSIDFEMPMRKLLLDSLERVRIEHINLPHCPFNWSERLREVLSLAIKIGVLSEGEVREILGKKLKRAGRACFEDHLERGTYPDHTSWPGAFAYALRESEFSPEEMEKIRFDHGDTVETFIQGYGKNDLLGAAFAALLPD